MRTERRKLALIVAVGLVVPGCVAENQASTSATGGAAVKGGTDVNGEYIGAADWWRAHPDSATGFTFGQVSGVVADTPERIIVGIRGERTPEGQEKPNDSYYLVALNGRGE